VFDPTTLPSARPGASSIIAATEIRSSGADVPKATTVRLTINAGTPSRREEFTAPRTKRSPARSKITRPMPAKRNSMPYPFPQGQALLPIRWRPQAEHFAVSRRVFQGKIQRTFPNIARTAMTTRKSVTVLISMSDVRPRNARRRRGPQRLPAHRLSLAPRGDQAMVCAVGTLGISPCRRRGLSFSAQDERHRR